tara:strand:- start:2135 stop:2314 length:180 start_codon:yes stop_codon:yes gene_type:complete
LVSIVEREELPMSNTTVVVYEDEIDTIDTIHEEAITYCKMATAPLTWYGSYMEYQENPE